jgi:hypothetical protein
MLLKKENPPRPQSASGRCVIPIDINIFGNL